MPSRDGVRGPRARTGRRAPSGTCRALTAALLALPLVAGALAPASAIGTTAGDAASTALPRVAVARTGSAPAALPQAEDYSEGLRVEASSAYTIDLTAAVVHVKYDATLTNQVPDQVSGGYIRQTYFDGYVTPVLEGITNVVATLDDGRALTVSVDAGTDEYLPSATISLAPRLNYGQTQVIHLTYDLPTQPPRSGSSGQVNQAFATFPVFCAGDPGLASVTVNVAEGLDVEIAGAELTPTTANGVVTYAVGGIADPGEWFGTVIARNDDALVEEMVPFGDELVRLQGWPGDAEWLTFTADLAERGLPALKDTIGMPWSATGQLDIVETSTPYVYGYAGWYEHSKALIEIGDDLDAHVTLHEMSHAWFNEELFSGRWIDEGLANEFAAAAMTTLGLEAPAPTDLVPGDPGTVALNDWAELDINAPETEAQEEYGYNASWWVVHQLAAEIGTDGLAAVVQAARDGSSPYTAPTDDLKLDDVADWRTLLDLAEEVGDSETAEQMFRSVVVDPADVAQLDARAEARTEYQDLLDAGDGWAPPAALRYAMQTWAFDDAEQIVPHVEALLEKRDDVAAALAKVDEKVPDALQEDFEGSEQLGNLDGVMSDAQEAADALVDAVGAEDDANPLARLGLLLTSDDDLAPARAALAEGKWDDAEKGAEAASAAVDGGTLTGALLVLGLVVLVAGAVVLVWWLRRRARVRAAAPTGVPMGAPMPMPVGAMPGAPAPFAPFGAPAPTPSYGPPAPTPSYGPPPLPAAAPSFGPPAPTPSYGPPPLPSYAPPAPTPSYGPPPLPAAAPPYGPPAPTPSYGPPPLPAAAPPVMAPPAPPAPPAPASSATPPPPPPPPSAAE